MRLVLDMNLSPTWVKALKEGGWEAVHWQSIGDKRAKDSEIMKWARQNDSIVFTHDLDFGMLLALTNAKDPSVIQVRTQDIMPNNLKHRLFQVLQEYKEVLIQGALITIDENASRIRMLPFS